MTTILALLVLTALFAGLVQFTRNDGFSGPRPQDRFRDSDFWLTSRRLF